MSTTAFEQMELVAKRAYDRAYDQAFIADLGPQSTWIEAGVKAAIEVAWRVRGTADLDAIDELEPWPHGPMRQLMYPVFRVEDKIADND